MPKSNTKLKSAASAPPWQRHRILICVGGGGTGKTTLAAALALQAAAAGKETVVVTVDPARRLAQALNLEAGAQREVVLAKDHFQAANLTLQAPLTVGVPNVRATFDGLLASCVDDAALREAVSHNPFYKQLTREVGGAFEYAVVLQLAHYAQQAKYEFIVIDTPPAGSLLNFIEAPSHLRAFVQQEDNPFFSSASKDEHSSWRGKAQALSLDLARKALSQLAGSRTINATLEFISLLGELRQRLDTDAAAVEGLLHDPQTGLLLVCGPNPTQVAVAQRLAQQLQTKQLSLPYACLNRMPDLPVLPPRSQWPLPPEGGAPRRENDPFLAPSVTEIWADAMALHAQSEWAAAQLAALSPEQTWICKEIPSPTHQADLTPYLQAIGAQLTAYF